MLALVAHRRTGTNALLAERGATIITPRAALRTLRLGDVALARLDVRPSLDGIEPGLWSLRRLERQGVAPLNPPEALVAMHDKLETVLRLRAVNLPHPRTAFLPAGASPSGIELTGRDQAALRQLGPPRAPVHDEAVAATLPAAAPGRAVVPRAGRDRSGADRADRPRPAHPRRSRARLWARSRGSPPEESGAPTWRSGGTAAPGDPESTGTVARARRRGGRRCRPRRRGPPPARPLARRPRAERRGRLHARVRARRERRLRQGAARRSARGRSRKPPRVVTRSSPDVDRPSTH